MRTAKRVFGVLGGVWVLHNSARSTPEKENFRSLAHHCMLSCETETDYQSKQEEGREENLVPDSKAVNGIGPPFSDTQCLLHHTRPRGSLPRYACRN